MFSLYLDWKRFYDFDIFLPGNVLYITKTNVKERDGADPFISTLTKHIIKVCKNNNLQFIILHNPIHPFSMEESLKIEQSVSTGLCRSFDLVKSQ